MQCNEIQNYLADYLAEDLEPATQEEFSRHLKECPACHDELVALTDLWVKLGSVPAGEPASPDLDVRLRASAEAYEAEMQDAGKGRRVWKRLAIVAAMAAAIAIAVLVPVKMLHRSPAVLEGMASSRNVEFGEVVRSGDVAGSTLVLADSSRVEMRAKSELLLERADDGVRIRLKMGSILVTAAKQHNGHLYVQTKDVTVSVVGTVFLVNAEEEGSRVAVIEGEVRVKQGTTETHLRKGEQVTTNPKMETPLVSTELEWSPAAETQLALLQRGAAPSPAVTSPQEKFEVASIRFKSSGGDGGREVLPGGEACPGLNIQIDPTRLSIPGATLQSLITLAYPEWASAYAGVNSGDSATFAAQGACLSMTVGGMLSGGPEWVRADRWDIQATIPEGPVEYKVTLVEPPSGARRGPLPTRQTVADIGPRVRRMLQNLLAERFQLLLRPQTKEMPVYLLTVGKDAFKSNGNPGWAILADGGVANLNGQPLGTVKTNIRRGVFEAGGVTTQLPRNLPAGAEVQNYVSWGMWKMTMPEVATALIDQVGRPVLNRTNLTGTFDFHIDYDRAGTSSRPTIFKAIEEVGLKLEPSRAPVELWIIERAEKPSEN